MSKKPPPEKLTLTFDLFDLPTAQHRAGLAGLILQIDAMGPKGYNKNTKLVPVIEDLRPTSAKISFTRDSMQGVFDELYEAKLVEVVVATKRLGKTKPKTGEFFIQRKDPKTGEMKQVPGFAYDDVHPQASCLRRHLESKGNAWLKLWRRMIWAIPRGGTNVNTRGPFNDRANGHPCSVGEQSWNRLLAFQEGLAKSNCLTDPISGALKLDAQKANAEAISFKGRVDQNLLLNFWQLVVLTFVPFVVNKKERKAKAQGYVIAIPDVSDLDEFRHVFPEILQGLEVEEFQDIPAKARINLPDQACLEVLRRLHRAEHRDAIQALVSEKAASKWGQCIRAVESFHMFKPKNSKSVKMLSFARVASRPGLIEEYERIKRSFRNPLFQAARMRAILDRRPWHWGMIELFSEYPWAFFIEGDRTPKYLPRFGRDAREQFQAFHEDLKDMTIHEMNKDEELKQLGLVIQRLVAKYVEGRAEAKTGMKVKDLPKATVDGKERRIFPIEFREAQQRVCSDAFLAIRSRHDQDFVEFFAGSICSVAQYLSPEEYQFLIKTLMTKPDPKQIHHNTLSWEDVKAVAMIAISACSFNVRPRDAQAQGSPS
jgi:CRISPR-associated protein Cmx8